LKLQVQISRWRLALTNGILPHTNNQSCATLRYNGAVMNILLSCCWHERQLPNRKYILTIALPFKGAPINKHAQYWLLASSCFKGTIFNSAQAPLAVVVATILDSTLTIDI
jgi:hypothetical protein